MPVLSKLEACPPEVLQEVTLWLVGMSFLGPPADILNVITLSKTIWRKTALKYHPHIYADIFRYKFDVHAAIRRLGNECGHVTRLAQELIRRFNCLKRLRNNKYPRVIDPTLQHDGFLRLDLWTAYLMFIESDGKNAKQLLHYARVDKIVSSFVSSGGRFHDGASRNCGWIVDGELNSLTAWLFWFTDKDRIPSETPIQRQKVYQAFAPFFVGSFKYASTYAPITSFIIPPAVPPPVPAVTFALSLAASPLPPSCIITDYFGSEITLVHPLLTPAALLICASRLEAAVSEVTLPPLDNVPATRAEAIATGAHGPTREDYMQQQRPTTSLVDWTQNSTRTSVVYDHDWVRLYACHNPWIEPLSGRRMYMPGMFDGVWVGRWFYISRSDFVSFLRPEEEAHSRSPHVYPTLMQFRLREHHQHDQNDVVPFDDISCDNRGTGVFNGWLPKGTKVVETGSKLRVSTPQKTRPSTYRTFNPAVLDAEFSRAPQPNVSGVRDIIVTAETDEAFGQAMGHKRYQGRVRDWDGLIVLVCEAERGAEERKIFSGYLHGEQNLVGRWRETQTPVDVPGWEGVWSMTKVQA